ncbi:hypothetical protein EES41_00155 [Streptomyces sp. ADI95-16]|uniref:hypothetical protein n=1 Tax=Streptomyces sp. ADI95-16 TaxID=1522758 RepID=UPI000F3A9ED8|nr:hypothetical protein [Streptomyces sp. ADI95-16]AYV25137.1 hypothetical protein EES41_00155 [Streptomyces sp. ADI95-16]
MDYTLITDPSDAGRALDDITPVFESVFAEHPYNEGTRDLALFLETYQREHKTPGFRLVLARCASGELAGLAYGLPLASTTGWWGGFLDTTPAEEFTRKDGQRTFVVKEIAVLAGQRRHGVGQQAAHRRPERDHRRAGHAHRPPRSPRSPPGTNASATRPQGTPGPGTAPVYRTLVKPLGA